MRLLNMPARTQTLLFTQGGAVKLKPAKPKSASRKGKKIYTDEVTAAIRLVRAFVRYKCEKLPAPLMRQQMDSIALWPAFGITPAIREKLMSISPAAIGRALENDRAAPALRGKSLTKSATDRPCTKFRNILQCFMLLTWQATRLSEKCFSPS
jgi:hypothetical protein